MSEINVEQAGRILTAWLPPMSMKSEIIVRPQDARDLHEAVRVLTAAALEQRQQQAETAAAGTIVSDLQEQSRRLKTDLAALKRELRETEIAIRATRSDSTNALKQVDYLTDRLRDTRQALAAYRSALRSGEPETDTLAALADTILGFEEET